MQTTIAFCTDVESFNNNKILDSKCAAKYPGAMWIICLLELCNKNDKNVITGDVAIAKILSREILAESVLVIQDDCARHASELIGLGAVPFLLMCLESPLYAGKFYSSLSKFAGIYKNRLVFRGAFDGIETVGRNMDAYFPSFSNRIEPRFVNWEDRHFLSIVAGNKYWEHKRSFVRFILSKIKDVFLGRKTYVSKEINSHQLHDKRLELIEYFGSKNKLLIFGPGWKNLSNLPKTWKQKLLPIVNKLNPNICEDKLLTISQFKFNICLENMVYPGYVTEKIIDCFNAGVIPIYLGAPDILDFIPAETFIDLRNFSNQDQLMGFLESMSSEVAIQMIEAGQSFLRSDLGTKFSYEEFSKKIFRLSETY